MNIKTKYDIGDKVWVIDNLTSISTCPACHRECKCQKWKVLTIRKIEGINVQQYKQYEEGYFIENYKGDTFHSQPIRNIFSTKEEAQAECDKRNKEGESK